MKSILKVGLTGGIGSGKSTVADLFARHGAPLIDADIIARQMVVPGSAALTEIVASFGTTVLDDRGTLNRQQLRSIVFADAQKRRKLESILHPRIRAEMQRQADSLDSPYCLLVIPLLVESGQRDMVHRILVVDVPEDLQRHRVANRDHLSPSQVDAVLAAQANRSERLAVGDDVIVNDGSRAQLEAQVATLHQRYLSLASAHG